MGAILGIARSWRAKRMTELVHLEWHDSIAVLTLNVPSTRNALSSQVLLALASHLDALSSDPQCQALVITGAGGNFCSGGDLSGMQQESTLPVSRRRLELGHRVIRAIVGGAKPVVAAVEGYAAGAGLSLAAAADYLVASADARFLAAFAKVGLMPDLGLLWTLPRRIGETKSIHIFATARVISAGEGAELGLVDQIAAPGEVLQVAIQCARDLSRHAPLPMAIVKATLAGGITTLEDALRAEKDNQSALFLTKDHREAVAAFMAKRQPKFGGA